MVGSFSNSIESISSRVGWWLAVFQMGFNTLLLSQWLVNGWQFFKFNWEPFCEGWMMVGCFSNEVQCSITLTMVGSWLAVFQIQLRAFLWGLDDGWLFFKWGSMLYHFNNGWVMVGSFSNSIESISSRVGWWLAVFQMGFNALSLSQWLGHGWQFFKLNWEHILKGWMMVGCFSDGVQCFITFSMVG